MTSDRLTKSYLEKAAVRIKALKFLHDQGGFSDVIRESQECVELLLKAVLRHIGVEIPKVHDVGRTLREHQSLLPKNLLDHLDEIVAISRMLRKERELAFYGTEDWIPTEEYSAADSQTAIQQAERIYQLVTTAMA